MSIVGIVLWVLDLTSKNLNLNIVKRKKLDRVELACELDY